MIAYIIKSTISLAVLYGFYHFFLRNVKLTVFNRFYLLSAVVFSLVIPFITIRITSNIMVSNNIQQLTGATVVLIQGEKMSTKPQNLLNIQNILIFFYLIGVIILFVRFVLNISNIIRKISSSAIINYAKSKLVLIETSSLPYSFFRYVFVNRLDFESNNIGNELIIHEQTHCNQYHSIDILMIELIKIVLWYNPFVWLFGKAIQLNHEYLADHKVLSDCNLYEYQNTLINLVFRNNSTYLASNFNYSLTKKRLIMMTKNKSKSAIYRITIIPIIAVLLLYFISCNKEMKELDTDIMKNTTSHDATWWEPILLKHNIKPLRMNGFDNLVEMGTTNSIDNDVVTLTDAIVVFKQNDTTYCILKAKVAHHNLKTNLIEADKATWENYKFNSAETKATESFFADKIWFQLGSPLWKAKGVFGVKELESASLERRKKLLLEQERIKVGLKNTDPFQLALRKEQEMALKEQKRTFQEALAKEREAAALEQTKEFQEKLTQERKAAAEGKIVTGNK